MLDEFEVVQPFSICNWLDLSYTEVLLARESIASKIKYSSTYHPGFAWCMTRKFYNEIGFFDYAFSGSGDTLSVIGWFKSDLNEYTSLPKAIKKKFLEFYELRAPKISFTPGIIINHLFHGSRKNRNYVDRHKMLDDSDDIDALTYVNEEGIFEWKDIGKNAEFFGYFANRHDDDISN